MTAESPVLQVMEVERFAIHDGPGIRTVVFLQGCPLRCPWCANPESWTVGQKLLYAEKKCVGCGTCAAVCPEGAVSFIPGQKPVFHREKCTAAGNCADACPTGALHLSGTGMTVDAIMDVVLRDEGYYRNSGGGLTVSGGEPFVQYQGFLALIKAAKAAGLAVAVETTGQTEAEKFRAAEPYIDTYLFDFKHPDPQVLAQVTKARPDLIFANLEWLAQTAPQKVILRVPVVPGFNHNEKDMWALFAKAKKLGFGRVHLLPYHTLGMDKYAQLGLAYPWPETGMLKEADLVPWQEMGQNMGLAVQLGG